VRCDLGFAKHDETSFTNINGLISESTKVTKGLSSILDGKINDKELKTNTTLGIVVAGDINYKER